MELDSSNTNGDISFARTIDGAYGLELTAGTAEITLSGAVGATTNLTSLTVNSCGSLTQLGSVTTTGNIALTGGVFSFNAPLKTVSTGTVTLTNSGAASFAAAADVDSIESFLQNGAGSVNLAANISTTDGSITFSRPLTLTGSSTFQAGGTSNQILFTGSSATINGDYALTLLNPGGTVTFDGVIGGSTSLESLTVLGSEGITVGAYQTVATGPLSYTGTVTLAQDMIFTNSGNIAVTFTGASGTAIQGNHSLQITANSSTVDVVGDIDVSGVSGSNGKSVTILGGQGVNIEGQLLSQGSDTTSTNAGSGGAILVTSSNGSVSVDTINTSGGQSSTALGGNGGNITLTPSNSLGSQNVALGTIVLAGDLLSEGGSGTSQGTGGTITLTANRSSSPSTATITSSLSGNDVTILGDVFIAGANEEITILGDLNITMDTSITIGDTIALEGLNLEASVINLRIHGPYGILSNSGTLYSTPALHFYGGLSYTLVGTTIPSGPLQSGDFSGVYTTPEFRDLLIYNDTTILNFDTGAPPPPPPPPPPSPPTPQETSFNAARAYAIYNMPLAEADFFDRLPVIDPRFYHLPKLYPYSMMRFHGTDQDFIRTDN